MDWHFLSGKKSDLISGTYILLQYITDFYSLQEKSKNTRQ